MIISEMANILFFNTNLILVSIYTECNRYYLHSKFLINLIQLNKSLNNINLKITSKIFRGKFYKLIHLDTINTNGYGFIYINPISKFQ